MKTIQSYFMILLVAALSLVQPNFSLAQNAQTEKGAVLIAMASPTENPVVDERAVEMNSLSATENVQTSKVDTRTSGDIARELFEEYMDQMGLTEGYNAKLDKHFYYAQMPVNVPSVSQDFGKARVVAFDRAYQEALKHFIKSTSVNIRSEVERSLFSDDSSNAEKFEDELSSGTSRTDALINKILALGDATLDEKLRELGVDPNEYSATPPDRRKKLLTDSFSRKIVEQTAKTLAGVSPIQTFIGDGGSGTQTIGVLIMYSPKLEAIAESLARGQKPHVAKQGPPLSEIIPLKEREKLFDLLGVRVMFDENGPVVVSYGQWSSSYGGTDEGMRERYRNIAFGQAEALANAQLSEFLNTSFSSMDSSEIGDLVERSIVKRGEDNSIEEETAKEIVSIRKEQARSRSSARLQGASTLKNWHYKTPEGHEIVGVIKTYSFVGMDAARKTFQPQKDTQKKISGNSKGKPEGRKSVDQMNINDF